MAATKSSSTLEHELRCFPRSRRSLASTLCELMRNAVLEEPRVPGRTSRGCRPVHVSHSCFAGFQHRSRSGLQLPVERSVLPFCSSRCASTLGLCAAPMVPGRRCHHSVEDPINLRARRSIRTHQRRRRDQTVVEPGAPSTPTPRDFVHWRFSYACRRRAWIGSSRRRPKTFTEAAVKQAKSSALEVYFCNVRSPQRSIVGGCG